MLEGVLKGRCFRSLFLFLIRFNPWYVGGGVKSAAKRVFEKEEPGFNPWYVGGGVKSPDDLFSEFRIKTFQSLVCWRGC